MPRLLLSLFLCLLLAGGLGGCSASSSEGQESPEAVKRNPDQPNSTSPPKPEQGSKSVPAGQSQSLAKEARLSNEELATVFPAVKPKAEPIVFNPDLLPVQDAVLIRFDRALDQLRPAIPFGIFRENQPPEVQWIEERQESLSEWPGQKVGFLRLNFVLRQGYNGWWIKPDRLTDWRALSNGKIVFRVRCSTPALKAFKLELKTGDAEPQTFRTLVRISNADLRKMKTEGYADLAVPLKNLAEKDALAAIRELVLVFEQKNVSRPDGDLWIHSIRLSPASTAPDPDDPDQLLEELARRGVRWFLASRNEKTGLVLDRRRNNLLPDSRTLGTIAGVGYYLSLLPFAVETGQIEKAEAIAQSEHVLSFLLENMEHHHGLYHHFHDVTTGQPVESEISLLDSGILMDGCMVAGMAFGGRVRELADQILDRADWTKFLTKHPRTGQSLLALGWSPKEGLLHPIDVRSSESAQVCFVAVGSKTHPVDPEVWYNTDVVKGTKYSYTVLNPTHPLFTSYYGLAWHPLEGIRDRDNVQLEANAREMALMNRAFCRAEASRYLTYRDTLGGFWGISAGDAPGGKYVAPGPIVGDADGVVWPLASLAAVKWIPQELRSDLRDWRQSPVYRIAVGPFGISPFKVHQDEHWVGPDLLAIDVGAFCLNYANTKDNMIRNLWMQHPIAQAAYKRLELKKADQ